MVTQRNRILNNSGQELWAGEEILSFNHVEPQSGAETMSFEVTPSANVNLVGTTLEYQEGAISRFAGVLTNVLAIPRTDIAVLQCRVTPTWGGEIDDLLTAVSLDIPALLRAVRGSTPRLHNRMNSELFEVREAEADDFGFVNPAFNTIVIDNLSLRLQRELRDAKNEADAVKVLDRYWLSFRRGQSRIEIVPKYPRGSPTNSRDKLEPLTIEYSNPDGGVIATNNAAILRLVRGKFKGIGSDELIFYPPGLPDTTTTLAEEFPNLKECVRGVFIAALERRIAQTKVKFTLGGNRWDLGASSLITNSDAKVPFSSLHSLSVSHMSQNSVRTTNVDLVPDLDIDESGIFEDALALAQPTAPNSPLRVTANAGFGFQVDWTIGPNCNDRFDVSVILGGKESDVSSIPVSARSCIVAPTKPNTQYTFRIRGANDFGVSDPVDVTLTTIDSGVPGPLFCRVTKYDDAVRFQAGEITEEELDNLPTTLTSVPMPTEDDIQFRQGPDVFWFVPYSKDAFQFGRMDIRADKVAGSSQIGSFAGVTSYSASAASANLVNMFLQNSVDKVLGNVHTFRPFTINFPVTRRVIETQIKAFNNSPLNKILLKLSGGAPLELGRDARLASLLAGRLANVSRIGGLILRGLGRAASPIGIFIQLWNILQSGGLSAPDGALIMWTGFVAGGDAVRRRIFLQIRFSRSASTNPYIWDNQSVDNGWVTLTNTGPNDNLTGGGGGTLVHRFSVTTPIDDDKNALVRLQGTLFDDSTDSDPVSIIVSMPASSLLREIGITFCQVRLGYDYTDSDAPTPVKRTTILDSPVFPYPDYQ